MTSAEQRAKINQLIKEHTHFAKTKQLPIKLDFGRLDLLSWLRKLNFKTGVEIGVAKGDYSEIICQTNPQMKVYGIDPWLAYRGYGDYVRPTTFDSLYQSAIKKLSLFTNYTIVKDFSSKAIRNFLDDSLDFVYIDANHTEPYISQDIEGWYKKVKTGGLLAGHDFEIASVALAVTNFARNKRIAPWFVLKKDNYPTWLIIK